MPDVPAPSDPVALDTDAIMWSAPEADRAGRPLLVLLHGMGSYEGDLFGLTPHLPLEPVIASVRAPFPQGNGFAWFDAATQTPGDVSGEAADAAAHAVLAWLETIDTSSGLGLLGFSQGAVVAAQLIRNAPRRVDYVVALSGYLARAEHEGDVRLRELPPPVFWGRGTADMVIPAASVEWSIPWFATHTTLSEKIYRGLGHSVSGEELRDISAFITARLAA